MTREETTAMLSILKAAYPQFYKGMSRSDMIATVNLWSDMFAHDDAASVKFALYELIRTHTGFPPDIAAVKDKLKSLMQAATNEATDEELWQILIDTVSRYGIYEAQKGFDSLPPVLKRYCGGPSHIRDLAVIDVETLNTVTHSTFLRSIKHIKEREEASAAMPHEVKTILGNIYTPLAESPSQLSDSEWNIRRNFILDSLEG